MINKYECTGCGDELRTPLLYRDACEHCGSSYEFRGTVDEPATKSPAFELFDFDFAAAMCDNWAEGIKDGRQANDWQTMEWDKETRAKYLGKTLRHMYQCINATNPGEAKKHAAAVACNANILWRRESEKVL